MAQFFIKNPIFAIVVSLIIVLVGLLAMVNLPIAVYPQITPPQVNVIANYPAANAQTVEQTVAQQMEDQVNGVEGMVSMLSTSTDTGSYTLQVQFELGKNPDLATVQAQNRVGQASPLLPSEVVQYGINVMKVTPQNALVFSLYSPKGTYESTFLANYGNINIVQQLQRVKGVGQVMMYGSPFGMRIWLNPEKMAQLGITTTDVYNAIKEQNVQAASGTIGQMPTPADQAFQYITRVKGRLSTPQEFENIIVRANPDGSIVRLKDIARVNLGGRFYMYNSTMDGYNAAAFGVQLTPDADALKTVDQCKEIIQNASKNFPPDMKYEIVVDNTLFIRESLKEVLVTLFEALLLVMVVIFIFLQSWKATLIPMLAVPVSLIGTFATFLVFGFSINTLTLFAMVLGIGLVVDDAIVVIEAVERHIRYDGMNPFGAAQKAMKEVSAAIVAIAFVLASVFIPVAFFGGTMGVLYKQFALTITVSMILSVIVALSLTPTLCARMLTPYDPTKHKGLLAKFFDKFNDNFERIVYKYSQIVYKLIRKVKWGLLFIILLTIVTFFIVSKLPTSFVPDEDQGYLIAAVTLPQGTSLNVTSNEINEIGQVIRQIPGVYAVTCVNGINFLTFAADSSTGVLFIMLKPWDERRTQELSAQSILRQIFIKSQQFPNATVLPLLPSSLPGIGTRGGFTIMLEDRGGEASFQEMDNISKEFINEAKKMPAIGTIYSTFNANTPGYTYNIDRDKVKKLGIPLTDVFNTMQTFYGGLEVNDINLYGKTYKVTMQALPQFRTTPNDIKFFYVRNPEGKMIPLSTFASAKLTNGPSVIQRFDNYRAIQIGGNPAPGYSSGQAMQALVEVAHKVLPATFSYDWADLSLEEQKSGQKAPILFALSLIFAFLCLAALYESWFVPISVILSVPTAMFGATFFQYIRHLSNNVYMQIGFIMLIGLAAKNAILIIQFSRIREESGMGQIEAIVEAARVRLRPILMTSFAFIFGCLPLAIASGAGSGARIAMGTSVVGGMLTGTFIGVFIIPVLYIAVEKVAYKIFGKK
ncbi:MAG TPA: multidrug efflux RND transporter permease subunit [Thermodesulfobium narugense]|nr:multidrug efflux RND transporter permease subunit [Thermodesulfobium narugense]